MEAPLTEEQVRFHFALIDAHTSDVVADEKNAKKPVSYTHLDVYKRQIIDSIKQKLATI